MRCFILRRLAWVTEVTRPRVRITIFAVCVFVILVLLNGAAKGADYLGFQRLGQVAQLRPSQMKSKLLKR